MWNFFRRWLATSLGVVVAAFLLRGIDYDSLTGLLLASLLLGILNAFLRPILILLSLPILLVTLGLFVLVINALLLYWVGWLIPSFHVASFASAFWGGLIISIISWIINRLFSPVTPPRTTSSPKPPPPPPGSGPIIDV